jgi:hypothetical protein
VLQDAGVPMHNARFNVSCGSWNKVVLCMDKFPDWAFPRHDSWLLQGLSPEIATQNRLLEHEICLARLPCSARGARIGRRREAKQAPKNIQMSLPTRLRFLLLPPCCLTVSLLLLSTGICLTCPSAHSLILIGCLVVDILLLSVLFSIQSSRKTFVASREPSIYHSSPSTT